MAEKEKATSESAEHASGTEEVSGTEKEAQPSLVIQKIYLYDASFEAPNTPFVFRGEWKPHIDFNLNNRSRVLEGDTYEVQLLIHLTAKNNDKVAFVLELTQVGLFTIQNISEEKLKPLLGSYCPSVIYPYARETVSSLITHGGFPDLYLAPINFDLLYQRHLAEAAKKEAEATKQ